jgi:hypothetical protein
VWGRKWRDREIKKKDWRGRGRGRGSGRGRGRGRRREKGYREEKDINKKKN